MIQERISRSGKPGSVPVHVGTRTLGHNSNADICKKAVDYEFINTGGYSAEVYGWTAKTANIGTSIRQILYTFYIFMLENKIQEPNDYLF